MHAEITKLLSAATNKSSVLPSPAKPMASVMPQLHANCVTEPASTSRTPAAMETEADEAETAALVEMLQDSLSRERRDADTWDSECRSARPCDSVTERHSLCDADMCQHPCHNSEPRDSDAGCHSHEPLDTDVCDMEPFSPAVTDESAACCDPNCCNVDAVRGVESSSRDNCRSAGCCHGNSDVTGARCSDYEAASVLTEMQQLTAAVTSLQPGTSLTLGTSLTPGTSLALGTSFSVAASTSTDAHSSSVNRRRAVPTSSSSLLSLSLLSNMSAQPVSGLSVCPSVCLCASLSLSLSLCMSVCVPFCLSLSMCMSLSVC